MWYRDVFFRSFILKLGILITFVLVLFTPFNSIIYVTPFIICSVMFIILDSLPIPDSRKGKGR